MANYVADRQESMQRFAQLLFEELSKRSVRAELIRPEAVFGWLRPGGHGIGKWLGYMDKFMVFPSRLKRRLRQFQRGDVLHICDHSNAVYTGTARETPHLVTCHDLLAIRSALGEIAENRTGATGRVYQKMILQGLCRAQRVACVSKNTLADLQRLTPLLPSQVSLVYNGLNYPYRPMPRPEAMDRVAKKLQAAPERFILHVGGNQWYKNRAGVVAIYAELARVMTNAPDLVMAGKEWPEPLRRQIAEAGLANRIFTAHGCDNEDLRALYSAAEALVFPSLMEGFGWPIIEAQACGCPVVTSNAPPMTEVGGEAAVYVNPRNAREFATVLRGILQESKKEHEVRRDKSLANAARFGTERMVNGYIEEYAVLTERLSRMELGRE